MDPLGPIAPHCKAPVPTELVLKENMISLSGDSATVKDAATGNTVFKINAHMVTLSQRRTISDASGKEVGQMRKKKTPGLHPACYAGTMDDEKRVMIKLKGMLNPLKCDAELYLQDKSIGEISGNWRAKSISIRVAGNEVAAVHRQTSATSLMTGADSYSIKVNPGVDMAFIVLVVLAFDELYHDKD